MDIVYGQGEFAEGPRRCSGKVIVSDHKIFLRNETGDISTTFLPLEKIRSVSLKGTTVFIRVVATVATRYEAAVKLEKQYAQDFIKDIVARRRLKKVFLKNMWIDRG